MPRMFVGAIFHSNIFPGLVVNKRDMQKENLLASHRLLNWDMFWVHSALFVACTHGAPIYKQFE